jgi:hypothetical protein
MASLRLCFYYHRDYRLLSQSKPLHGGLHDGCIGRQRIDSGEAMIMAHSCAQSYDRRGLKPRSAMAERKAVIEAGQRLDATVRRTGLPKARQSLSYRRLLLGLEIGAPRGIDPLCRREFEDALTDAALLVPQLKAVVGHVILGPRIR